jgi:RsiW-degrading membrane proteinase PrsW (M82 family)
MAKAISILDHITIMTVEEGRVFPPGLGSRIAVSIIIVFAWLIYAIIHVVFLWKYFSTVQNVALLVIAFLLGLAILGAIWTSWGIKIGKDFSEFGKKSQSQR